MKSLKKHFEEQTSNDKIKEYIIGGLTFLSALAVRGLIKFIWKASTNTEPPENPASRKVSWQEAFLFTVLTGIMVSITKLIIRRNVSLEVEENY